MILSKTQVSVFIFNILLLTACGGTEGEDTNQSRSVLLNTATSTPVESTTNQPSDPQPEQTPPAKKWIFGGMYGEPHPSYINPVTGGKSCLPGYDAIQIFGQEYVDYPVYVCTKEVLESEAEPFEFGGLFGLGQGGVEFQNPFTNTHACPIGFEQYRIFGSGSVDWTLYFCMKERGLNDISLGQRVSGFYGKASGFEYPNPLLNPHPSQEDPRRCPDNYRAVKVFGSPRGPGFPGDNDIFMCVDFSRPR